MSPFAGSTEKWWESLRVLVTGGAGFIGSSASRAFLSAGHEVAILEDFSRPGSGANLDWINEIGTPTVYEGSIVDSAFVNSCMAGFKPEAVYHLAAQVAVTLSVQNPRHDFETNALGTFNLLEATRTHVPSAHFVFSSTNKVYGDLARYPILATNSRYSFQEPRQGIQEDTPLDFHSPYGCSKGAADTYVTDYSRIYGLRTTVLRQSCIYGTRQFGIEDQGWIAWFVIAALLGRPVKVFGDGRQVRDALHIEDLIRLYDWVLSSSASKKTRVFNVGGGPANTVSVLELLAKISSRIGQEIPYKHFEARQGDQKIFVSDNSLLLEDLGWSPKVSLEQGLDQVVEWTRENLFLIEETLSTVS